MDRFPHGRAKKILFLTYGFQVGGAETLFVSILNHLDTQRIIPTVVSLAGPNPLEREVDSHIEILRFPRRWRYDLAPVHRIASHISDLKIETVLALNLFSFFYAKLAVRKVNCPVRLYISFHSTNPRSFKEFAFTSLYTRMLSGTDQIVPTCENQKRYLKSKYHIAEKHFSNVIFNGIDTSFWTIPPVTFDRKSERAKLGIPEEGIVILNIARFQKEKRHDLMVKAFAELLHSSREQLLYLVFVGGGSRQIESSTRELAHQLGVDKRVVFAGRQAEIRSFYWIADLFTLGSTSETFSIAALEAMSCGLPCVLTDVGGASEMISDSENGILVPPGSAETLATGWSHCISTLASRLPGRIREGVLHRFELKKCVNQYEDLLLDRNH